jgi:hypothetical protein
MLPSVISNTSALRLIQVFAAPWLAYVLPYRRFVVTLTNADARLGAGVGRYSFTVVDLHLLLFAGFHRRTEILDNRQRGHQLHWTGRAGAIPDGLDQHSCRGPAPPPAPRQQAGHQNVDIQCQTENPVFAYWRQSLTASASL